MRVGDELVKVKATPTAGKDACLRIDSVRPRKEQVRRMRASKRGRPGSARFPASVPVTDVMLASCL